MKDLGGKPAASRGFQFPAGTFTSRTKFLSTASAFEELGVTAYHGQVPRIEDPDILKAAASIAGVESRHAAIVADLLGGEPVPGLVREAHDHEPGPQGRRPLHQVLTRTTDESTHHEQKRPDQRRRSRHPRGSRPGDAGQQMGVR
ncbi:MAG: ferritin-like domain-containing protein [Hymenobacter sp.]